MAHVLLKVLGRQALELGLVTGTLSLGRDEGTKPCWILQTRVENCYPGQWEALGLGFTSGLAGSVCERRLSV